MDVVHEIRRRSTIRSFVGSLCWFGTVHGHCIYSLKSLQRIWLFSCFRGMNGQRIIVNVFNSNLFPFIFCLLKVTSTFTLDSALSEKFVPAAGLWPLWIPARIPTVLMNLCLDNSSFPRQPAKICWRCDKCVCAVATGRDSSRDGSMCSTGAGKRGRRGR